jgi:hypothetical protein
MVGTGFIKPTTRLMADVDGFWQSLTKLSNVLRCSIVRVCE